MNSIAQALPDLVFSLLPVAVLMILVIASLAVVVLLWFRNMKWNKTEYVALYEAWQRTWYCNTCGNVFRPA